MAWVTLCENVTIEEAVQIVKREIMKAYNNEPGNYGKYEEEDSIETKEEDEKDNLEVNDGNRLRTSYI